MLLCRQSETMCGRTPCGGYSLINCILEDTLGDVLTSQTLRQMGLDYKLVWY